MQSLRPSVMLQRIGDKLFLFRKLSKAKALFPFEFLKNNASTTFK